MSPDPDARTIDTIADPDALRDHEIVEHLTKRRTVDAEELDAVREDLEATDGWVVVGVENDAGAVLLMDDGSHGWTLPAAPVREGDWVDRGRRAIEGLTGVTVDVTRPERVRRIEYQEDGGDGRVIVHHVVLRAESVIGEPVAEEPAVGSDDDPEVGWFDALPDEVEGVVAEDARLFIA